MRTLYSKEIYDKNKRISKIINLSFYPKITSNLNFSLDIYPHDIGLGLFINIFNLLHIEINSILKSIRHNSFDLTFELFGFTFFCLYNKYKKDDKTKR